MQSPTSPLRAAPPRHLAMRYHYDHLGSTRKITNSAGSTANTYVYNAWGEAIVASEGIGNRFRWVGELGYYHEVEDDDYYVRARYYDLSTGRWMSQDPLGVDELSEYFLDEHIVLYRYGANNPVSFSDSSGMSIDPPKAGCLHALSVERKKAAKCPPGHHEAHFGQREFGLPVIWCILCLPDRLANCPPGECCNPVQVRFLNRKQISCRCRPLAVRQF